MSHLTWTGRAHVRTLGDAAIILDLVADRYLRVPVEPVSSDDALRDRVGVPIAFNAPTQARLVRSGLLQRDDSTRAATSAWDILDVLQACAWAHTQLRAKRLHRAIARLAYLKMLGRDDRGRGSLQAFDRWRPLYPHDYVCLIDSLALARYTLLHGMRPCFVIGVRDAPFSAHAWVVLGGEVVNDRLGQWRSYLPILEV